MTSWVYPSSRSSSTTLISFPGSWTHPKNNLLTSKGISPGTCSKKEPAGLEGGSLWRLEKGASRASLDSEVEPGVLQSMGHKESDTTEWQNWTEHTKVLLFPIPSDPLQAPHGSLTVFKKESSMLGPNRKIPISIPVFHGALFSAWERRDILYLVRLN